MLGRGESVRTVYLVNEVFETIQGEAYYTGSPSVFVRLQGCDVGCPWCDTKHTWQKHAGDLVTTKDMLAKVSDAPSHAIINADDLVAEILKFSARHVVITGGEPCDYDLTDLTSSILAAGRTCQIETSGTSEVRCNDWTYVTVSPKVGMPGGRSLVAQALCRADEIKMPVGKPADIARLLEVIGHVREAREKGNRINGFPTVWLQPLSQSEKATELCIKAATENGWRLSMQTHKYIGVR